jgi:PAS domain S-box-containing protein
MIVEDEILIAMELSHRLKKAGYDIIGTYTSGEKAIPAAMELHPDIILMDISLGNGIDGIETARQIRLKKDIPIIYITAFTDVITLDRAKQTGPYGYLMKPFEQRELENTIEIAIYKHKMEMRIRENEERYRIVVEQISDGIIFYNFQTKDIIWSNHAYQRFSGFSEEELLTMKSYDIVAHQKSDIFPLDLSIEKHKNYFIGERKHRRKDGSEFDVEVSASLLELNNIEVMVLVVRDITERKVAEAAIKVSEQKFRNLFDTMIQGIVYQDNTGKVILVNPAAVKILGLPVKKLLEAVNNNFLEKLVSEEGSPILRDDVPSRKALKTGLPVDGTVMGYFHEESNQLKWVMISAVPEFRPGETIPCGAFTTFSDITELKNIQESLKKSEEELKQTAVTKDKFFSIIAHDLKSPFLGLLGFASILIDEFDNLSKEEMKKFIGDMNKTTKNLYQLIEHLLEWSRLQTGRLELNLETIDLRGAVESTINYIITSASNKGIKIIDNIPKDISIKADAAMLNSVMENLISNSIKFTESGGAINISLHQQDGTVEIIVSDNGKGMRKETVEKLFRLDVNISTRGTAGEEGTGLGLILSKEFIERQNGKIWVDSTVGEGTAVHFTLPLE